MGGTQSWRFRAGIVRHPGQIFGFTLRCFTQLRTFQTHLLIPIGYCLFGTNVSENETMFVKSNPSKKISLMSILPQNFNTNFLRSIKHGICPNAFFFFFFLRPTVWNTYLLAHQTNWSGILIVTFDSFYFNLKPLNNFICRT
jgi:hypothetical protein